MSKSGSFAVQGECINNAHMHEPSILLSHILEVR